MYSESIHTLPSLLKALWCHIGTGHQKSLFCLFMLMFSASIAEVISIGAVLPFLMVLTSPERLIDSAWGSKILSWMHINSVPEILWLITIIFCSLALISGVMRLTLSWSISKISFLIGSEISVDMYRKVLYQPYQTHISRNTSELIDGISNKSGVVIYRVLLPTLNLLSSLLTLLMIFIGMMLIDPYISAVVFLGFGSIYFLISFVVKTRIQMLGRLTAEESTRSIKALQEGLGGIRDISIESNQEVYCRIYSRADASLRASQGEIQFLASCPKNMIEALIIVLISFVAYFYVSSDGSLSGAIPLLGSLALGAQRLMPALQQVYASYTSILGARAALSDVVSLLDQEQPRKQNPNEINLLPFMKEIKVDGISFKYDESKPIIFEGLDLSIKKGDRIGFIGTSGGGKSTLLDILMGLLRPTAGSIFIDDERLTDSNLYRWQKRIAHVPQSIFLLDTTIIENIAFGSSMDEIDFDRVLDAAKRANIDKMISELECGYDTVIGERGVKLSGGQRQRIGIARALYKKSDVIILDEATSALDEATECKVMHEIEKLNPDITMLIISHRISTLTNCNKIYEISNLGIKRNYYDNLYIDNNIQLNSWKK